MILDSNDTWIGLIVEEWLLFAAAAGFALTSIYAGRLPAFSLAELQVLFLLFVLFVVVKGLEHSGFISRLSRQLEQGRAIPLKLILITFFLSMVVTNDVALTVIVPLTLMLSIDRKDVLVILEALAANAGSALTPIGNPQNLFIYWFYDLGPGEFLASMAKFSLPYLALLVLAATALTTGRPEPALPPRKRIERSAYAYAGLLCLVILTVLRILPLAAAGLAVVYAVVFDRRSLRVDYALLLTFLCFFGLTDNIRALMGSRLVRAGDIFLVSAVSSQFISNVPATLLFAKFTTKWNALLWGANVGGFGSLVGSLANLIAYKFFAARRSGKSQARFAAKFLLLGYIAFFIGIGLYFAMDKMP